MNAEKVEIYTRAKCYLIDQFMIWLDNIDLTTVKTLEFKPIVWDYEIGRHKEHSYRFTPTPYEMFYGNYKYDKKNSRHYYRNVNCVNARKFINVCVAKYKSTHQIEKKNVNLTR